MDTDSSKEYMHISLCAKGTVTVVCCVVVKAALVGLNNVAKHRSFDGSLALYC